MGRDVFYAQLLRLRTRVNPERPAKPGLGDGPPSYIEKAGWFCLVVGFSRAADGSRRSAMAAVLFLYTYIYIYYYFFFYFFFSISFFFISFLFFSLRSPSPADQSEDGEPADVRGGGGDCANDM